MQLEDQQSLVLAFKPPYSGKIAVAQKPHTMLIFDLVLFPEVARQLSPYYSPGHSRGTALDSLPLLP